MKHTGKTSLKAIFAFALIGMVLPILPARADINVSMTYGQPAAWDPTPVLGTATPSYSVLTYTGASALEQTITIGSSPITLDKFEIAAAGGLAYTATVSFAIYQVTDPLATSFTAGATVLAPTQFTYIENQGTPFKGILTLDLTGSDQVTLNANTSYAISLKRVSSSPSSNPGFYYYDTANDASSQYVGGALYYGSSYVAGDNGQDVAFAVYAVPEPSALVLAVFAFLGLSLVRVRSTRTRNA